MSDVVTKLSLSQRLHNQEKKSVSGGLAYRCRWFSPSGLPINGKRTIEGGQALLRKLGFREAVLEPHEH